MSRITLDSLSNPSSTAARILAYMKATELSDVSEGPGEVQKASDADNEEQSVPNFAADSILAYQNKLKYSMNSDFHFDSNNSLPLSGPASLNSNNARSIPNTFKYKSHPNAKTKHTLGKGTDNQLSQTEETSEKAPDNYTSHNLKLEQLESSLHKDEPMRTSTLNKKSTLDFNSTPDWMPAELGEKWNEENFSSSVRITKNSPNAQLEQPLFLLSTNTMIHNSKQGDTPAWKKASKQFEEVRKSQPQLQNIFVSELLNTDTKAENRFQDSISHSMTSTTSTSMASVPLHLSKDQLQHLEHLLEQEGVPAYIPNPESPLKLFGDKYNTFTKDKLADVLQKMNKPPKFELPDVLSYTQDNSSLQNSTSLEQAPLEVLKQESKKDDELTQPKYMIRNFTKSGSYSEQQFLQNANNIFNNIQKRGFKTTNDREHMQSTATSTPKNSKVTEDDYSSFTTGFNDDTSSNSTARHGDDDYTSMGSRESNSVHNSTHPITTANNVSSLSEENLDKLNSLTFEQTADTNFIARVPSPKNEFEFQVLRDRLNVLEKLVTSDYSEVIKELKLENDQLRQALAVNHDNNSTSEASSQMSQQNCALSEAHGEIEKLIKWKRASQLKLRPNNSPFMPTASFNSEHDAEKFHKQRKQHHGVGNIKPSSTIPTAYNNMVLDVENQRWVSNGREESIGDSLNSIEDLQTMNDKENNILKPTRHHLSPKAKGQKQEVSFQLPHESETSTPKQRSTIPGDVTQVSQLDEITFTETQKKLVSILTEVIPQALWTEVTDINLSSLNVDSVKGLKDFLPNLLSADISDNNIRYLTGIPENILLLKANKNELRHVTSFQKYLSLQQLQLSDNDLTLMENLRYNIHLNRLLLSSNQIRHLNGIENLRNLIFLDLSRNQISGEINFSNYDLPNLQELNLSENRITSAGGIENLQSLRILNVNDNNASRISCLRKHVHLKKLLLKGNKIKSLDVNVFPSLRILRLDGNYFTKVDNLHKLNFLDELSLKSQPSKDVAFHLLQNASQPRMLDLSGNAHFSMSGLKRFVGVNQLILSAMEYELVPPLLHQCFLNVCELNLNFNRLTSLAELEDMRNLKKVLLVSNSITKLTDVISSLSGSKHCLEVLDLRLNPINFEFYPYVFSPNEIDADDPQPIQLESLDDIESFAIHYKALTRDTSNWEERDSEYIANRISRSNGKIKSRINYETLLVNYFPRLRKLDGITVTKEKRRLCKAQLKR